MASPIVEPSDAPRAPQSKRRIIVADDDRDMRDLVCLLLRRSGYEVEEAENGEVLLDRVAAELDGVMPLLDLIVTDVRMPAFSGIDLLESLRNIGENKAVILMTAFPDEATRKLSLRLHAQVLEKPFDVRELSIAVRNALGEPAPVAVARTGAHEFPEIPRAAREKILVAEDDDDMRMLVVQALSREGFDVRAVRDTLALRRAFDSDSFALVVSDVRMPGGSGLAIVEELRRSGNQVPIVLMTAFGDATTGERAQSLGAFLFDKPFELADLRALAKRLIRV